MALNRPVNRRSRALLDANKTQWDFLLSLCDRDGDGILSVEELWPRASPAFRSPDRPGKGEVCRTLFDLLDSDDDGSLTEDECLLAAALLRMSAENARTRTFRNSTPTATDS
ncbi:hypothetical protein GCM10010339_27460 [Streptomyces alanosinicus]|uniref:EF-hand domain-containing protein n=1 Tax=Streptomyces alanosinicus TaxID=68171 RepID=A0A918YGY3_9ACTN|nr:EF-hand domain-containing protein [Streptomyces alanosinicus]GHE02811.1 hypothetical protein GCM10010339_27460 [Streptomyces alanosinicus]